MKTEILEMHLSIPLGDVHIRGTWQPNRVVFHGIAGTKRCWTGAGFYSKETQEKYKALIQEKALEILIKQEEKP